MYMKSSEGDANKVLIAYSLIYMLPLSAKIPFKAVRIAAAVLFAALGVYALVARELPGT